MCGIQMLDHMKKNISPVVMIGVILVASVIGGASSFYIAGGIPKLASAVGPMGLGG